MKKIFILFVLLLLLSWMPAYASNLTINDRSGFHVDFSLDQESPKAALAGEFKISLENFTSVAYCVELGVGDGDGDVTFINPTNYSYFTDDSLYDKNGLYAAWLMDQYATGFGYEFDENTFNKDIVDAALQIAIWETLYNYEKTTNEYTGNYFDNTVYDNTSEMPSGKDDGDSSMDTDGERERIAWDLAEIYKTDLKAARTSSNGGVFSDPVFSGKYQFYVAEITTENGVNRQNLLVAKPIPEPATILLFGLGLLGISAMGRKRS